MNLNVKIAIAAGAAVLAGAGVLFPMRSDIGELQLEVQQLESERVQDAAVAVELEEVKRKLAEFRTRQEGRVYALCPDTPEARSQLESDLLDDMSEVGLKRISMDSRTGVQIGGASAFVISLVVEGDPGQVHRLLLGMEDVPWLTRVLEIDVKSGGDNRRTAMEIAVLLEELQS